MKRHMSFVTMGVVLLACCATAFAQQIVETNYLISYGSTWKYLDNGSNQGTNWSQLNCDDGPWASGPGQLGYGDGDEATIVSYGPDAGNKYITTYFRYSFFLPDAARFTNLMMRLLRDDGGGVYINGREAFRSPNMPAAPAVITYTTLAGSTDDNTVDNATLTPSLLRTGTNVVAVEIHQEQGNSSDLSFDFELRAVGLSITGPPRVATQPRSQTVRAGGSVNFSVVAAGELPLGYQWRLNGTNLPGATAPGLALSNVQPGDSGVYTVLVSNRLGMAVSANATLLVQPPFAFDVSRDFSAANNPNGPWSYGYKSTFEGAFTLYGVPRRVTAQNQVPIDTWSRTGTEPSEVQFNGSTNTATTDNGQGVFPPGTVIINPGLERNTDNFGVIRLTIPAGQSGTYVLAAAVQTYLNGPSSGDTDFHVLKNGVELCGAYLLPNSNNTCSATLALAAGDTLEFAVGRGIDGRASGSGVKLQAVLDRVAATPAPPQILAPPQNQMITTGSNVIFGVVAASTEPLTFQWRRNGVDLPGATGPVLVLTQVQSTDAGQYSVMVSNALGSALSASAMLLVVSPATYDLVRDYSLTSNPNGPWTFGWKSALNGSLTTFPYHGYAAQAGGAVADFWQRDASGPATVAHNPGTLTITNNNGQGIFPPGAVWLIPGNDVNPDNYAAARFTTPPGGGGTYRLNALAQPLLEGPNAGDADFHVLKNGIEIFGEFLPPNRGAGHAADLTLAPGDILDFAAGRGQDGQAAGSGLKLRVSLNLTTTNPVAPSVLVQPKNQRVALGSPATFTVLADGTPPLRYQWRVNGEFIVGATNATLALSRTTLEDAGLYQVTISNSQGAADSAEAALEVVDLGPGLFDPFDPDINRLQWSAFGGTVLATNYGGSVSGNNSLWFGGGGSRFAITRPLDTTPGGMVGFFLRMGDGTNAPWEKPALPADGIILDFSTNNGATWIVLSRYDSVLVTNWGLALLEIPTIARAPATLFRWRQQSVGASCCNHWALDDVRILVDPAPPLIVYQPQDQTVPEGGTATLRVGVMGSSPLSFQWRRNGELIPNATSALLTLTGVTPSQAGKYSVKIGNAYGSTVTSDAILTVVALGENFRITSLTSNDAFAIEHWQVTGDDRGGIAASANQLFVTGDSYTGRFLLDDLSGGASLGRVYDALVGDLRSMTVYSLANDTEPFRSGGGTVTRLLELDPETGDFAGREVRLSTPISMPGSGGIFSGYGQVVLHNGSRVYAILLPSGFVVDWGAMSQPSHNYSESWAYWGVAEYYNRTLSLVYVRNSTTIARTRVPDGLTSTLASFGSLSDMASFTVAVYRNRWYFHHENNSQFRSGDETVGYARATFDYTPPSLPLWVQQPRSQFVLDGGTVTLKALAIGAGPITYQWLWNGEELAGATNTTLTLTGMTANQAGAYAVRASNALGSQLSATATLAVVGLGPEFQITSLTTNGAHTVDTTPVTAYGRAMIAASSVNVWCSGSSATARFNLEDLSGGASFGRMIYSPLSNLRTEIIYSLGNGTNEIDYSGETITTLLERDPNTGQLTGNRIDLSAPISLNNSYGSIGIFSGYDRVVIHTGTEVCMILLPSGVVVDLGPMPALSHVYSGMFAYWGVAEFSGGAVSLVYARDYQSIVRTRVPDGATTPVATFPSLGDTPAFTVCPSLNRWYIRSSYGSIFQTAGQNTLGYADATFACTDTPRPVVIVGQPVSQAVSAGSTVSFAAAPSGSRPFSYQWLWNGDAIPGATNAALTLSGVTAGQAGKYSVQISNALGAATSAAAVLKVSVLPGDNFQITSLTTNGALVIEHGHITGDTRSAIAASASQVFYSGDSMTARFDLGDLSGGTSVNRLFDALVSNLRTETVYSLGNGSTALANGGGTVTTLLEHDGATGALTGNQITLSSPIPLSGPTYSGMIGIFAGYDRIVLHDGSRVYNIALPSGQVTELGSLLAPAHAYSQSWAYWGVAEFVDGVVWLVYVRDYQTIVRTRVPDGLTTTVASFSYLGEMSAFTVSLGVQRWYFHHTGSSLFRSGGDETLGFADAAFAAPAVPQPPAVVGQPHSQSVATGSLVILRALGKGTAPLSYQWIFNGADIPDATNATLELSGVTPAQSGTYAVRVSNALGSALSDSALLSVTVLPGENFQITTLSTNNVQVVEHDTVTGYGRNAIAASASQLFYSGDSTTALFDLGDLSGGTSLGRIYDGLVSNLRTETVYSLGASPTTVLPNGGGTVTTLLEHDGVTGALTGNRIPLSVPIYLAGPTYSGVIGIFAGYDRIVLHDGSRVYNIALPSGEVTELGLMASPPHTVPHRWAYWGVAEYHDGVVCLVYVRDSQTIVRTRVPDGLTTTVAAFSYLGDMAAFTVSPLLERWYFQHSYSSQFSSGEETLGFADATFAVNLPLRPPAILRQPQSLTVADNGIARFTVSATGTRPLFFQWRRNGMDLPGETNSSLVLNGVTTNDAGAYSVVISNALDLVASAAATLSVVQLGPDFFDDFEPDLDRLQWTGFGGLVLATNYGGSISGTHALWFGGDGSRFATTRPLDTTPGGLIRFYLRLADGNSEPWEYADLPDEGVVLEYSVDAGATWVALATYDDDSYRSWSHQVVEIPLEAQAPTTMFRWRQMFNSGSSFDHWALDDVDIPSFSGPPAIWAQPQSQNAFLGGPATFSVSAVGTAPRSYQWQFNGMDIPGATNAVLDLSGLTIKDTGKYSVVVSNSLGVAASQTAVLIVRPWPDEKNFRITALLTNDSRVVEHAGITGSSRGGIAASAAQVFYTGWNYTGRFLASDLSGGATLDHVYDGLVGNLRTETVYSLGHGTNLLVAGGGTVTTLLEHDPNTGALTGNSIALSRPIPLAVPEYSGVVGIFAGYDRIVLHNGTRVYSVELPSGEVMDLGAMAVPYHQYCDSWAYWGVAEQYNGAVYLVYVRDSRTIVRTRVPDGETTPVAAFTYLSDMCSITLSLSRNRWYFQHQYTSQFGGMTETLGYCEAAWALPPSLSAVPPQTVAEDNAAGPLAFSVGDGQTPVDALVLSAHSSDTNLVPVENIQFGGSGADRTVAILPATNAVGTATITITARNDFGATANRAFQVTVTPVNDPPTFTLNPEHSVGEDAGEQTVPDWMKNLSPGPTDEAGQALTILVSYDNPALFGVAPAIDAAGTLTYTPAPNASGTATVTVTLQDDGGTADGGQDTSAPQIFTITVSAANDPPSFVAGSNQSVLEDAGAQIVAGWATQISAGPADEVGQALTFVVSHDNPALFAVAPAVDPAGTLTYTPAPNANGAANVTVLLRDNGGTANNGVDRSSSQTFTIAVLPVNDAPSFVAGTNLVVLEDAGAQSVTNWAASISAGPPDEAGQALTFLATNDNPGLFAVAPAIDAAGTLTYTPAANANGTATVTVVLKDDGGTASGGQDTSAPQTFTITVLPVNDAPVAYAQAVALNEDGAIEITLGASDPDGDALTYMAGTPSHGALSGTAPRLTYRPDANYFGPDSFSFQVSDGQLASEIATVTIAVHPVNDPPVAIAQAYSASLLETNRTNLVIIAANNATALVVLDGSASWDLENDPLEYFWLKEGEASAFAAGMLVTNALGVGSHRIVLGVFDGTDMGTDRLHIEVITAGDAVGGLLAQVDGANLDPRNARPLAATLQAAVASFDRGSLISGVNQLQAFQNKVRAQVAPVNPALAEQWIRDAREIITAVSAQVVLDTGREATGALIGKLEAGKVAARVKRPLIAALESAAAAFEQGGLASGISHLQAFQNKVRAQVGPAQRALADQWIRDAQEIISALGAP